MKNNQPILVTGIATSIIQARKQLEEVSDSPSLDAELLLAFVLDKNRTYLRTWPEKNLSPGQNQKFQSLLKQRYQGQPIAYLLGYREFWSRQFLVSPDVLIPRPDTELLVAQVLAKTSINQPCNILDLGTGSGAIAITLAAERRQAHITATDISDAALNLASKNRLRLKVENIQFQHSDWFQQLDQKEYDIIVSNPPYIDPDDPHLSQGDIRFEPELALISTLQGLQDIKLIADHSRHHIKLGGALFLEHGYQQHLAVQAILNNYGYQQIVTVNDLSDNPRITWAHWH